MNSFKILISSLVVFFCTIQLSAQETDITKASEGVKKIAKHNANKWKDRLMLSVNQTKMMQDRITEYEMKKNAIFMSKDEMDVKNSQLTALDKEFQDKIHDVMTPEQYDMYRADIKDIAGK